MWHDITLPLSDVTPRYPGDPPLILQRTSDRAAGDPLTMSQLSMSCHVGTHVDAPAHFIADGATVDALPLASFVGPAVVLDLTDRDVIRPQDFDGLEVPEAHHVLLRTRNSELLRGERFEKSYCHVTPEAAHWLCRRRPASLGFDYYSLDPFALDRFPAHTIMAAANVPVFVCLVLENVAAGRYTFAGLPLPLVGAEAAPVRACLSS